MTIALFPHKKDTYQHWIMGWNIFTSRAKHETETEAGAPEASVALATSLANALGDVTDNQVFISRQPIMDHTEKVRGYELMVRASAMDAETLPATTQESTRLLLDTLNNFGVATAIGDRLAFVVTPPAVLESSVLDLLPKQRFVLEYPSSYLDSDQGRAQCAKLRNSGFQLACRHVHDALEPKVFSQCADYAIFDLAKQSAQQIAQLDRSLKSTSIRRLIRNVNVRSDFEAAQGFDFDLYQGNFFARNETMTSIRIDPMRERAIEILNLVMNRADVAEIEEAFKHDVALCYSLLCYINSVGIGLQFKVASIRNAVMLLGYDFLWRWLSLLVYAGIDLSAAQRGLLNTAIIRGRLAELLGQKELGDKGANLMFVTGAFSLLDALLGIPMDRALERINVPREVSDALLRNEGRLAPYLQLAIAFEQNNFAQAKRLCNSLGISIDDASHTHIAAIEWAGVLAK